MFRNRARHERTDAHALALDCLAAGIDAARPDRLVADAVSVSDDTLVVGDEHIDLSRVDRWFVIGGGKAAGELAHSLTTRLGDRIDSGLVVGPTAGTAGPIELLAGDHPVPTDRTVEATRRVCELAGNATGDDLVIVCVTGGASAMLCAPADDLSVADLRETTRLLLESGASIEEINAVRKHCSAVKGGRLARTLAPATVLTLAISDVVGDDPAVIGSGPTVPDPTTYADARAVLARYDLLEAVPSPVRDHLARGAAGDPDVPETPTADEPAFQTSSWHLLAGGETAVRAARRVADDRGYESIVLSRSVVGEAETVGWVHAAIADEIRTAGEPVAPPAVVLSAGEVTVTVRGDGTGGPNQELALAGAVELADREVRAVLASVDTDGVDGPTDWAGALVDETTVEGLVDETTVEIVAGRARAALAHNDAGTVLDDAGATLETGSTGTNVNDLRVLVLSE